MDVPGCIGHFQNFERKKMKGSMKTLSKFMKNDHPPTKYFL
jgi:hypothetical protein